MRHIEASQRSRSFQTTCTCCCQGSERISISRPSWRHTCAISCEAWKPCGLAPCGQEMRTILRTRSAAACAMACGTRPVRASVETVAARRARRDKLSIMIPSLSSGGTPVRRLRQDLFDLRGDRTREHREVLLVVASVEIEIGFKKKTADRDQQEAEDG